ncbi:MAG TPA: dihydroneopterin aldolase [Phycisphaerae bacterium]|nr:dihydroneopterin aldolase [Phycisphaerae bacterium]
MIIEIENLRLRGIVGVYEHEQACPQDIIINAKLTFNAEQAVETDDLEYAVDYEKLIGDIRSLLEHGRFRLLETVAQRITDMISADRRISHAEVKVSKPHAISAADRISVIASFDRLSQK